MQSEKEILEMSKLQLEKAKNQLKNCEEEVRNLMESYVIPKEQIEYLNKNVDLIKQNLREIEENNNSLKQCILRRFESIKKKEIKDFFEIFIIIILLFLGNSKNISIILFLLFSNGFFIFIATFFLNKNFSFNTFFNIININIFVLFLGFVYKTIFFLPLKIDFIYYFSIKDYIIIVFHSVLLLIYFFIIFVFMEVIFNFLSDNIINKRKINFINNIISYCLFLASFFILNIIFIQCIFSPLNIVLPIYNMYPILISFYCLRVIRNINRIKNLNSNIDYFKFLIENKIITLFLILMFFINLSFLKIYTFIGESQENLIKKGIEYKMYKDEKIFKIDSSENYNFYISKPNNEPLIFEKNYNVIKN